MIHDICKTITVYMLEMYTIADDIRREWSIIMGKLQIEGGFIYEKNQ